MSAPPSLAASRESLNDARGSRSATPVESGKRFSADLSRLDELDLPGHQAQVQPNRGTLLILCMFARTNFAPRSPSYVCCQWWCIFGFTVILCIRQLLLWSIIIFIIIFFFHSSTVDSVLVGWIFMGCSHISSCTDRHTCPDLCDLPHSLEKYFLLSVAVFLNINMSGTHFCIRVIWRILGTNHQLITFTWERCFSAPSSPTWCIWL